MKKSALFLFFTSFILLIFLQSCTREKIEKLTEGVIIQLNTDLMNLPLTIQFVDADLNTGIIPDNISIDVIGKDKDKLYLLTGEKDLKVVNGILNLGIEKSENPTNENPLQFSIIANAPGYLQTIKFFSITDEEVSQYHTINMVHKNEPPDGVSVKKTNFQAEEGGITEEVTFQTELTGEKEEKAEVLIHQGTEFFDSAGNGLTGQANVTLVHFDNRNRESILAFPGGLLAELAYDEAGNEIGPVQFTTAGFITLDISVGGVDVETFSQPIEMSIGINPETVDPNTGEPVQAGDEIPVWSLDEETGAWHKEGNAIVEDIEGKLTAKFIMEHLSWWNLDYFGYNSCYDGATIIIHSNIDYSTVKYFYSEIIDVNTGFPVSWWSSAYKEFYDGIEYSFWYAPDVVAKLVVYSGSWLCPGDILAESEPFNLCGGVYNLDFMALNDENLLDISVDIRGICEAAGPDIAISPYGYIYFKSSDCYYYDFLGTVRLTTTAEGKVIGTFNTSELIKGVHYNFMAVYGGHIVEFVDVPIATTTIVYEGETIEINVDSNPATLSFDNIMLPGEFCTILLGGG